MNPTPQPLAAWQGFVAVVGLFLWPLVWWFVAKRQRLLGRGRVARHFMGAVGGTLWVMLAILVMLLGEAHTAGYAIMVVFLGAPVVLGLWYCWREPRKTELRERAAAPKIAIATPDVADEAVPVSPVPPSQNAKEPALADERAATSGIAPSEKPAGIEEAGVRVEPDPGPVPPTQKAAPNQEAKPVERDTNEPARIEIPPVIKKPESLPKKPRRSRKRPDAFAEIEFDYEDYEGNSSRRRVSVYAVNATYVEGFCHERRQKRTFRLERIEGKIADMENRRTPDTAPMGALGPEKPDERESGFGRFFQS